MLALVGASTTIDQAPASLGELLREHRRAAGLTQEELAERAGVSPRSISELERGGEHVPRRDTVSLLIRALGLSGTSRQAFEASADMQRRALLDQRRLKQPVSGDTPLPNAPAGRANHNVPRSLTSFIGRQRELDNLAAALASRPLLTLVGTGGVGKTRLAEELVRRRHATYADGCWFVELAGLTEASLLSAIAAAVGLHATRVDTLNALIEHLAGKQMLLVLDNCEHLVQACAEVARELLSRCPALQVLATSREPLSIDGETIWQVLPLELPSLEPAAFEHLGQNAAVRLFVERARAVSRVSLTADVAGHVARICIRLDGIPLAIELAAARTRMLGIEQLADMLDAGADVLTSSNREAQPRQRGLRATIDWSHDLLTDPERILLRRLSVFACGWTLDAAEEVCSGDGIGRAQVLDLLGELVAKSMVLVDAGGPAARYRLLEPIRQYAFERLQAAGEVAEYRARHAALFLALAQSGPRPPDGLDEITSLERLDREHANLRVGLCWAIENGQTEIALRSASALFRFWERRGHFQEGRTWLEQALARDDAAEVPVHVRTGALNALAFLYWRGGVAERAQPVAEQALAVSSAAGHTRGVADALLNLGMTAFLRHDYPEAVVQLEEAARLTREAGRTPMLSVVQTFLARVLFAMHGPCDRRASLLVKDSLALAHAAQSRYASGHALATTGDMLWGRAEPARAVRFWTAALTVFSDLEDRRGVAGCLERLALALVNVGQVESAAWLFGAAAAQHAALGMQLRWSREVDHAHFARFEDQQKALEACPGAWSAGQRASLTDSVARAIEAARHAPRPDARL